MKKTTRKAANSDRIYHTETPPVLQEYQTKFPLLPPSLLNVRRAMYAYTYFQRHNEINQIYFGFVSRRSSPY